jgi:Zn-dependent peptidase ImmA (M78 family)/DNA-binding XRE family transcriptional regulator
MDSIKAVVKPTLLEWGRKTAGLSIDDAARKINTSPERIRSWEEGTDRPSLAQLRTLSKVYKRSFSDFYLPEPPEEEPIPRDFRRLPGEVALVFSSQLRFHLRAAQRRRAVFRDLAEELGVEIPQFALRAALNEDVEAVATRIREAVAVDVEQQRAWRGDSRRAYRHWRAGLERLGVLTFQVTGIALTEMLGFALAYRHLPAIAINRKLRPNGRVFTLLHETTHLLLGRSGICDLDEEAQRPPEEQEVEVFCNAVAGAALVPRRDLLAHPIVAARGPGTHDWTDDEVGALARLYCASEEVIVRRLLLSGRASRAYYAAKRAEYLARYSILPKEADDDESSKPEMKRNMPREALSDLGRAYARIVLESFHDDRISLSDASDFLSLKPRHIDKLEKLLLNE